MTFGSVNERNDDLLSIVIPAYNEEERLPETIRRIHSFLDESRCIAEIIVVNDGSSDDTLGALRTLEKACPELRIISYATNQGKGFAVQAGVLAASGRRILFSDADLSAPIEEVQKLSASLGRGYDVAIGSRHLSESRKLVSQPLRRRLIGKTFNWVISTVGVRGFYDTQCGFKLFTAEAAKRIFPRVRTRGWAFDVEVLLRAREFGFRVAEVAVRWKDSPGSRLDPLRDPPRMLLEVLRMRGLA